MNSHELDEDAQLDLPLTETPPSGIDASSAAAASEAAGVDAAPQATVEEEAVSNADDSIAPDSETSALTPRATPSRRLSVVTGALSYSRRSSRQNSVHVTEKPSCTTVQDAQRSQLSQAHVEARAAWQDSDDEEFQASPRRYRSQKSPPRKTGSSDTPKSAQKIRMARKTLGMSASTSVTPAASATPSRMRRRASLWDDDHAEASD